ncbi:GDP-mannose 4,6-dehydratase [Candidatus Woesearchaeota archaeon]|nr:GDP-mannose 4,6-dehydratase [Candidatus Woesearchaeota archaeon]
MDFAGKNILITGGLGFIGSNLAIELVRQDANVTILDSLSEFCGGNLSNIKEIKDKAAVKVADISDKGTAGLVKDQELIFNLAGHVSHIRSIKLPIIDYKINVESQLGFLELCRKNTDATIIYAGTRAQYGKTKNPVDEGHPQNPVDVNGVNKFTAEQFHLLYSRIHGLKAISLRLTNVYGPKQKVNDSQQGFFNWLIRKAMEGSTIELYGGGKQLRDLSYVDDTVSAMMKVSLSKKHGEAFNVGSGNPISILESARLITETAKKGRIISKDFPKDKKKIEIGDYYADISKIKELGWEPKTSLKEGIEKTIEFYNKNKENYFK